jgi:hypothetical protein
MKIRFVKEDNRYTLQVKNFIGVWRTKKEKVCSDAGCFYQSYVHENKQVLLRYVLLHEYFLKHNKSIIEYPTIKKYKPFHER